MSLEQWVDGLATTALVGTTRRALPERPELPSAGAPLGLVRPDASTEVALLDAIAVTAALRRAAAGPAHDSAPADQAADDRRPPPPPRARQLLDLLLTQSPVGSRLSPNAILTWLRTAEAASVRVHHPALVGLLEAATGSPAIRAAVPPVLDARGAWLAAANPVWAWAAPDGTESATVGVDQRAWALLPTADRALAARRLRADDAAAGRDLVETTWSSDPAAARVELIGTLAVGLSIADEPFLERALDDRAGGVRDAAYRLLDALPESARARRLGDLLATLVSSSGLVRKKVQVELPISPTADAARDGLVAAPRGRSERGFWLERLAAGAPFTAWTDATHLDPGDIVRTLDDADALSGLRTAAVARRDTVWARALLDRSWDPVLARCLPPEEVTGRMVARIGEARSVPELLSTVALSPGPWDESTSNRVLARLERLERPPHVRGELSERLAVGLHPGSASTVARLVDADAGPTDPLHQLVQYLSLVPTITEAFA